MGLKSICSRRAFSPVIAAILVSGIVLAVGGAVWAFSQGAMIIAAEDYAESVINMTDTISERFIVENVAHGDQELKVWIYNYGDVDIEVKIQVESFTHPEEWKEIAAGGFEELEPLSYLAEIGEEIVIRAYTRRGNNVYYRYLVP